MDVIDPPSRKELDSEYEWWEEAVRYPEEDEEPGFPEGDVGGVPSGDEKRYLNERQEDQDPEPGFEFLG